jgi:hypothetical protein
MGGNGALHYAARHPDLFVAAASFSGANDVFHPVFYPITETTEISNGATPGSVFGPRATQQVRWRAFNPVDLAGNLGATWVSLAFGNGIGAGQGLSADPIEMAVHDANVSVHQRLVAAGIPHVYDDYGTGNHSWPYWSSDLAKALPRLMAVFAQHRRPPRTVTYSAIDSSYGVFGWDVRLNRSVLEMSRLERASKSGFVLTGSGRGVVRTPGFFRPGQVVTVVSHDVAGASTRRVEVARDGRVTVPVDLGPANAYQQDTAPAQLTGTAVRTARVTISQRI